MLIISPVLINKFISCDFKIIITLGTYSKGYSGYPFGSCKLLACLSAQQSALSMHLTLDLHTWPAYEMQCVMAAVVLLTVGSTFSSFENLEARKRVPKQVKGSNPALVYYSTSVNERAEVPNARLCSVPQKETNAHTS